MFVGRTSRSPDVRGDGCDYLLTRNLVLLAVALASEALIRSVLDGSKGGWYGTLRDFANRPLEKS
jgi:molybdopterin-synthase adenylyltransferase